MNRNVRQCSHRLCVYFFPKFVARFGSKGCLGQGSSNINRDIIYLLSIIKYNINRKIRFSDKNKTGKI